MKDDFLIKIETWHKADLGTQENVSVTGRDRCGWILVSFGTELYVAAVGLLCQRFFFLKWLLQQNIIIKHVFCVAVLIPGLTILAAAL